MTHRGDATQDKTVKRRIAKRRQTEDASGESKSSEAILLAAVDEFSERGFDGARMEAIAERAGYNKSLVYRHYKDKRGLFEAVLRHKVEQRVDLAHRLPDELAAILEFWFEQSLRDPSYLRLLIREALDDTGEEIVEEASRRAYYREHTDAIASFQEAGRLSNAHDPAHLNLAMTAPPAPVSPGFSGYVQGCGKESDLVSLITITHSYHSVYGHLYIHERLIRETQEMPTPTAQEGRSESCLVICL